MIRFLSVLIAFMVAFGTTGAFAEAEKVQENSQQATIQKQNKKASQTKKTSKNKKEVKATPKTDSVPAQDATDSQTKKMPKIKSDAQIRKESSSLPKDWEKMTEKERQEYSLGVLEDRFILTTSNFKIISLASGIQICSFDVSVGNNSARTIQKIFINYHWGEDSTYVEFSDLKPLEVGRGQIALAGSVCKKVTGGADYTATTCRVDGLTQEQCRLRLFGIK